jgi:hypothetical protein
MPETVAAQRMRGCIFFVNEGQKRKDRRCLSFLFGYRKKLKRSGQVNCPSAKVLPHAKRL